ncbi:MAG TPA: ATP-grasp domain-containing protein [Sphingomonas sp.]|nr:ATP-grasp domain-containing protein [Sphingomonas sp.]
MKAFVTGAGAVLGQGIIKSLRQSTLACEIVAADPNPLSAGLYWADRSHSLPVANDPAFGERVTALIDRERPDVVLVGTDVELAWFAHHRSALEDAFDTQVIVSDPRVIAIADDKYETSRFLAGAGLHPPRSAPGEDTESIARLVAEIGFPLIVKPRVGARSVGVSIVRNQHELDRALEGRTGLVVQECVGSDEQEYTASVLVFDGEPQASIVMRRDLRDGNTYRAYVEEYPELNEAVRRFGAALKPHGPANFQFRTDADGVPRVFEINARFSGTTPMRALVGFNEVEMCIRKLLLDQPIQQPVPQSALILRFLEELCVPHARAGAEP